MNLRQLRYFIALAEYRNFSVAANHLYISQPTLSQEIAKLEREFGFALFVRMPRSILLTEEAEELLPMAQAMIRKADEFMEHAGRLKKRKQDTSELVIGLDTGWDQFESRGITDQLNSFRRENPEVNLTVLPFHFPDALARLESGAVDIAVIFGSRSLLSGLSCRYQILAEDEICLVVPASMAQAGQEQDVRGLLSRYTLFVIADDPDHMAHVNMVFKKYDCQARIVGLRNTNAIIEYVSAGGGAGLVSKSYLESVSPENIRVIRLIPDAPMGYLAMLWSEKCKKKCAAQLRKKLRDAMDPPAARKGQRPS